MATTPLMRNTAYSVNEAGLHTFHGKLSTADADVSSATACGKHLTYTSTTDLYSVVLPKRYKDLVSVTCTLVSDADEIAWVESYDLNPASGKTTVVFGIGSETGGQGNVGVNELFFTIIVQDTLL